MNCRFLGVFLSIFLPSIHYNPTPQGQLGELAETTPLLRVHILTGIESSNLSLSAIPQKPIKSYFEALLEIVFPQLFSTTGIKNAKS